MARSLSMPDKFPGAVAGWVLPFTDGENEAVIGMVAYGEVPVLALTFASEYGSLTVGIGISHVEELMSDLDEARHVMHDVRVRTGKSEWG